MIKKIYSAYKNFEKKVLTPKYDVLIPYICSTNNIIIVDRENNSFFKLKTRPNRFCVENGLPCIRARITDEIIIIHVEGDIEVKKVCEMI